MRDYFGSGPGDVMNGGITLFGETKDHTEHLFLNLAVALLSFSKGS